ncbi:DUF4145 domain-containing protein [Lentzea aerocolonigenes]|uniref:DUF4145 domain-containing protein n=1 Tax=Lentzea aerocolonigenes TaxID=68170 RepID=UPI0012DBFC25|nr:DUF4145 domain-containing protein [Lentzea aerocolonigenes]
MMLKMIGGFDDNGEERPMTYRRLKEVAQDLVITSTTPEGPANLLDDAREMFAMSFYRYPMVTGSAVFSIFAVEAALKLRLNNRDNFQANIQRATQQGLISAEAAEAVDAGRQIRNNYLHEGKRPQWTLGQAYPAIGASFRLVSERYPEPVGPGAG